MGHPQEMSIKPPSRLLTLAEGRAILELGALMAAKPLMNKLPEGDGHTVVCMPGFMASERSLNPMIKFLEDRGYTAETWSQGRNLGLRPGLVENLLDHLDDITQKTGRKASLVGWSLGGIFAREIAKMRPDTVRQVLALGSPFAGPPSATHAARLYEFMTGHAPEDPPVKMQIDEVPPMPFTSIFTKTDGIVNWRTCIQKGAGDFDNIEVKASHCGIGVNPAAFYVLADRLAQREDEWENFHTSGWRQFVFKKLSAAEE